MAWNDLKSKRLKYGQKLVIWKEGYQKNEDKHPIAKINTKLFKSKKTYMVQRGDTLWSISQKADIPLSKLKKLNRLKGNEVKPGQKLLLG
jgi:membrane-bound lytic murein transglycosylase D